MIDFVDIVIELLGDYHHLVFTSRGTTYIGADTITSLYVEHDQDNWSKYTLNVYSDGIVKCSTQATLPPPNAGRQHRTTSKYLWSIDLHYPNSLVDIAREFRRLNSIRL